MNADDEAYLAALKDLYDESRQFSDESASAVDGAFEEGCRFGLQMAAILHLGRQGEAWPSWVYE